MSITVEQILRSIGEDGIADELSEPQQGLIVAEPVVIKRDLETRQISILLDNGDLMLMRVYGVSEQSGELVMQTFISHNE